MLAYKSLQEELSELVKEEVRSLAHCVCHIRCINGSVSLYTAAYREFLLSVGVAPHVVTRIIRSGVIQGLNEYNMLAAANSSIVEALQASSSNEAHVGSSITPSMSPRIAANAEEIAYICQDMSLSI